MKKITCLLIIVLIPIFSFSQINYSVKGKVITSDGYLPAGNVIALHPKDSTFINGSSFFEGVFELNDLNTEDILLKFSSLEFDDTFLNIKYENNSLIDLGEVKVGNSGATLDEVVLKNRKPLFKQKTDGTLEVLVENTILSASNTVDEILSKSPEIVTNEEGFSVFGKGRAILYLNGVRITDNQLALISPSNVKKIEIIRNPSSKYDAEGASVINISTIKKGGDGYKGSLKQNVDYSDFGGTNTFSSLNLNYNNGHFSSKAYYSLRLGENRMLLHTTRNRDDQATFLRTNLTTDWKRNFKNYSYYGLGLQYTSDKGSYFSIEYSGFSESLGGNQLSNNNIIDNSSSSFFKSDIGLDEKDKNNSISLNYKKAIDTLGTNLFVGALHSGFKTDTDNLINEDGVVDNVNSSRLLKSLLNLDIDIFSGQVDYTKVFKNENTLEAGMKYSYVENRSNLDFLVSNDGVNFGIDNNLSNNFNYEESIGAGYLAFKSRLFKKFNYTLGIRSEYTKYDLNISQVSNRLIEDDYINFFPNFSINTEFSDEHSLNFSYASRINRPAYQRLNPVLVYQDPYTSVQGNPELQPEKIHAFELGSNIKKTNIKIGYNFIIDPMGGAAIRGEDPNSYVLTRINLEEKHEFFSSISRTFSNNWWTSTNTVNVKYTDILKGQFDFEEVDSKPNFYFNTNNRFKISDSFNAEVTFWYLGDNYEGLYKRNSAYNLSMALDKSFFNNSLKCRLIANDIFHGVIASGNYNVGDTDIYYNRRWTTDYFRLSLTYKFGKLKKVKYKNKSTGETETRRVQ